ncbi:MAG: sulfatase-like hydrolase/transferase, partial [Rikenellaceae bacterium]
LHLVGGQLPDYWGNTYYDDTYYRDRDIPEKQDGYCTDIFVGETERFATENRDKPFFVYLALNSAHAPFNVDAEYSDLYKGNTAAGNPKICGMITNIDDNIARLRETLKEQGLDKNTVIILFGDNGSNNAKIIKDGHVDESVGYNGGFRGKKSQPWEGGHRQAMLMHIPSQPLATTDTELAMCYDLMPTLINLCGLTPSRDVEYDGVDLLSEESRAGRVAVVDTQRSEFLRKYAPYAVMKDDWRLIDGKSLYNLSTDRAQKLDVADSHPELVAELKNSYEEWWERTSVDKDLRHPIPLSTNIKGESVLLNGHDIHTTNGKMPVWNQQSTCQGKKTEDGFWSVEVTKSGKYDFELYRWAPSSGLNLNEATPRGREIPNNGARYPAGGAITNMKRAAIVVDDVELASCEDFPLDRPSISIPAVKLPKGYHELKAVITDSDDQSYIAWFVNVRRR